MGPGATHGIDDALATLGVTVTTLTAAQRDALDDRGYLVLPGAVGAGDLDRLRSAFDRASDDEGIPPRGTRHPRRLLEADPAFARFLTDPRVLAAVVHVLGRPFRAGAGGATRSRASASRACTPTGRRRGPRPPTPSSRSSG